MRWNPAGAVVVITGTSSGIGYCLTKQLLQQGSIVVANARRRDALDQLAKQQSNLHIVAGDISDPNVRVRVVQAASALRDGAVDLLVNNAGIGAIGRFAEASPERLRRVMEVNFFAPAELTRQLIPSLRRGRASVICNIGSVLGHCAVPDKSEYCASKFALHGWSDSLRAELSNEGIQVTLVSPSTTRSEFFDSLIETDSGASSKSFGSWTSEKVASKTIRAIKSRRREVILSLAGISLVYADRLAPSVLAPFLSAPPSPADDRSPETHRSPGKDSREP
jgi:short-subunit dehydrogenase